MSYLCLPQPFLVPATSCHQFLFSLQFEMVIALKLYLLLRCHVMQPKDPVVDSRLSREACPELLETFVIPEMFVHSHTTL